MELVMSLNRRPWLLLGLPLTLVLALAPGCAEDLAPLEDTAVGDDKPDDETEGTGGKDDAWDSVSDPNRFGGTLNYRLADLPRNGRAATGAWPSSYFPTYEDSVNVRWNNGRFSPAELYDMAFNGWTPPEGFDALRPFEPRNCDADHWDPEYYDQLGPLARLVSRDMGNRAARDGRDSDGDGQVDECDDMDGVATWWGLCHAWVPASMLEDEPQRAVTHNGVTFEVGDLEALLILAYNRSSANMIGGRCNLFSSREEMATVRGCRLPEVEAREGDARPVCSQAQLDQYVIRRDEHGRAEQSECRDTNAGSFHVIMTNYLGLMQRPFAYDRTYDFEVWNQPIVAFEVTNMQPITVARANELLGMTGDTYTPNTEAAELFEVYANLTYITESHASRQPAQQSRYERRDYYTYIVEVDADGDIIGGEWTGNSRSQHPDFLWDPARRTSSSVANLDLENVRMLIRQSREPEAPVGGGSDGGGGSGSGALSAAVTPNRAIPDNDPAGVRFDLAITDAVTVGSVAVELDIDHTYVGDLTVTLRAPDGTTRDLHNREGGSADDIQRTINAAGFDGVAAQGTWQLVVADHAAQDEGTVRAATLRITPSAGGSDEPEAQTVEAVNATVTAIPDNDPTGATVTATVPGAVTVGALSVEVAIRHTYIGDLTVTVSHGGTDHVLHQRTGGGNDDILKVYNVTAFDGADGSGAWTLRVVDGAGDDVGRIERFAVRIVPEGAEPVLDPPTGDPTGPESFAGEADLSIPDNSANGVSSVARVPAGVTGTVSASVNVRHTYRGDLKLVLRHGEQSWTLHDRTGGSADDLVQAFPVDGVNDPAGEWVLQVSDHAARDTGKLVSWSLVVTP
jgi:subtilisin-like proprotein convertase family protein